jgi:hypothetical protein
MGVAQYFISKTLAELPLAVLFSFLFGVIAYWMVGFNPHADRFLRFQLTLFTAIQVRGAEHRKGLQLNVHEGKGGSKQGGGEGAPSCDLGEGPGGTHLSLSLSISRVRDDVRWYGRLAKPS